ncbi:MAG: nucleotidyltransferase domain-containing protein [Candidatus Omnitrophota bacterium]|nr:nucleotidyltransferase domain-containing protein [Candidatus Omnitrophota bacterium]MDZ4242851.1 nucleotidyltransferase domain-containing protein [Candidatus Omnitrophota bacterium]
MISLRSKITREVLQYLLLHESESFYVNELARKLSLDSGNLTRKLLELEAEGLLKSQWQGNQRYFALNTSFPLFKEYKKIIEQSIGLQSTLKKALQDVKGIEKAFVFGSYAAGRMDRFSDIDLVVVGQQDTIAIQKKVAAIQRQAGREINVISLSPREFAEKSQKDVFLKAVLRKKKIDIL